MAEWMDLTGKVIIVTGGSRGIGEHVVKILRRNNATVIVADLTPNPDYESDENILFINCNVAKKDSVDAMVKEVIDKYGKIDGLLNNAGVSRPRLLVDFYGEKPEYELSEDDLEEGKIDIISLLVKADLAPTRSEARRNIQQGGVSVNGKKVDEIDATFGTADFDDKDRILLKKGKKKFCQIKEK